VRRYLLDTGPAQDFINRRNGIQERADAERHRGNRIGICMPVLGELWSAVEEASRVTATCSGCIWPCRGW
jgi:hypothetical protein